MYQFLEEFLYSIGMKGELKVLAYILTVVSIILIAIIVRTIARFIIGKFASRVVKRTKVEWDDVFFKNKVFHIVADFAFPVVISLFSETTTSFTELLNKISLVIAILIFVRLFRAITKSINDIYINYEISKSKPIRGFLQALEVVVIVIAIILILAALMGESPLALLGGIGAMTAVLTLIFQDTILGLVAGMKLTYDDLIRIGDWISAPSSGIDGTVIDISMTTVRVENFDKTISAVPAYDLMNNAFINYRNMTETGGRRMVRSITVDGNSIKFCDDEMLDRYKEIDLVKEYIENNQKEIDAYNKTNGINMSVTANGKRLTNLGIFRAYILEILKNHENIRQDMAITVRQVDPKISGAGVPIEVYAFIDKTGFDDFANIQSDIFEHIYSVVNEFDLRIYQSPSGEDLRKAIEKK